MTVISPEEVVWTTARPEENGDFVAFVDACFGRPPGRSLRREFPTALAAANHAHHFEGRIGGRRVCAATALVRTWRTAAGPVEVACVGSFSTDPAWRAHGLSGMLQAHVLDRLRDEGVQWAALWTDRPEIYAARGFRACGSEIHGRVDAVRWPSVSHGESIRPATAEDAVSIHALYREHPLRSERSVDDLRSHLDPAVSQTWVLERENRIVAYSSVGKGEDFPAYVHEYGGDPSAVHRLWGVAVAAGAVAVLLPAGSERYRQGVAATMPGTVQPSAMIATLADGPRPASTAFAVWGFDSA